MRRADLLCVLIFLAVVPVFAGDMKVRTVRHETFSGSSAGSTPWHEETLYVQGLAQRQEVVDYAMDVSRIPHEQPKPHIAVITHCDTLVGYEIDLDNQEYREFKMPKYPSQKEVEKVVREAKSHKRSKTIDTSETRDFHGRIARHQITTIKIEGNAMTLEETVDGWYLDMPPPGCAPEYVRQGYGHEPGQPVGGVVFLGGPRTLIFSLTDPRISVMPIHRGILPEGFPIQEKTVSRSDIGVGGRNEVVIEQQIIDLSEAPLDPSLFDVPPGFKKVSELYKHKPTKH